MLSNNNNITTTSRLTSIVPFFDKDTSHLELIYELDKRSNSAKQYLVSMSTKTKLILAPDVPKTIAEAVDSGKVHRVFAIVGSRWAGKSTISNSARQIYGSGYNHAEKATFADLTRGSIVKSFTQIILC